ncbi:MAG: 3'-5' exonuclease [Candidatus Omnitrophica bacterium]|nr:3'-5' exonuclease [Candidatus Omnitrophota bacterium]
MKNGTFWVIIDTETDGLFDPIHIVELAGQLMEGWHPVGKPFRMLLNHNVYIPPAAVAIHGYTQEYLREHGEPPRHVHAAFRDYAKDYPLIAHMSVRVLRFKSGATGRLPFGSSLISIFGLSNVTMLAAVYFHWACHPA